MALRAVVLGVGETLVDETGLWEHAADAVGVHSFTFLGVLLRSGSDRSASFRTR